MCLTWSLDRFANGNSSLSDGSYRFSFNAGQITDLFGNPLDGNGNGIGGDNFVLQFHRLQGDSDGNAIVNDVDAILVNGALGATPSSATWNLNADLDRDNRVTVRDRVVVARANGNQIVTPPAASSLAAAIPGDFNENGIVDAADYTVWRKHLGTGLVLGDAGGGLDVDGADNTAWRNNYGIDLQTVFDKHETAIDEVGALAIIASTPNVPIIATVEPLVTAAVVSTSQERTKERIVSLAIAAGDNSVPKTITDAKVEVDAVFELFSSFAASVRSVGRRLSSRQTLSPLPGRTLLGKLAVAHPSSIAPAL